MGDGLRALAAYPAEEYGEAEVGVAGWVVVGGERAEDEGWCREAREWLGR